MRLYELQVSHGYTVRPCLKTKPKQKERNANASPGIALVVSINYLSYNKILERNNLGEEGVYCGFSLRGICHRGRRHGGGWFYDSRSLLVVVLVK